MSIYSKKNDIDPKLDQLKAQGSKAKKEEFT